MGEVEQGSYLKSVVTMNMPNGTVAQNVFYHQLKGLSPVDDSAMVNGIVSWLETLYGELDTIITAAIELVDVMVHEWVWDPVDGWITGRYVGEDTLTDAFAGPGDAMPNQTAMTVTGYTDDVRTRSRKSIPGCRDAGALASELTSTSVTALIAWAVEWLTSVVVGTNEYLDPGVPALEGVWREMTGALVSDILGSQRQRKPGVGI